MCLNNIYELGSKLCELLSTLKKNREYVPLEILQTQYRVPYETLKKQIGDTATAFVKEITLSKLMINPNVSLEEQISLYENKVKENTKFLQVLEKETNPGYEAFSPREFNSFHKEKMEELRAELGAMFIESDLNIQLKTENYQDHSDYLKSWLEELEADPNELFRACADAEKIAEYLVGNYEKKYQIPRVLPEEIPDKKGIHKKEKSRTL